MDLVIRNAAILGTPPIDIGIKAGRIVALETNLAADAPVYDAQGHLTCAGLIETHIHLDKTRIIDRCPPEDGRNANAVPRVAAVKHTFTEHDVYQRASATLENCIKHGTTRMRTHVELDGGVEMRSFDALEKLRRDYAWAIDIELCVFPQEGLTNNKRSDELLVEALKRGASVIGAAPNYDPNSSGQIHRIFELAREYDVDIDMHLDSGNSPVDMDIYLVCELTRKYGLGGRVAVGHGCKYSTMPPADLTTLAAEIADAGVAVTVLPATDLYMMGRDQDHSIRRGVANANVLVENGVNCSISSNNILNPFTPLGDGNLIRIANLQANVCQIGEPSRLRECFAMLTDRSAKLMNLPDYGIAVGNPADVVVFDATTPEEAIAEVKAPAGCFQAGSSHCDATKSGVASAMKLSDIAQVIRSKNAGPRRLTLDIMFGNDADYQRVVQSPALGAESIGRLYRVPADQVTIIPYPVGRAIKIVMARSIMAGDPGDYDVYGAQQHAPLLRIEL